MSYRYLKAVCVALALSFTGAAPAQQSYPNRPIRIYTSEPGGGTDLLSRIIAQGATGPLGQPVVVENRPSNVLILGELIAKSPADGYSLLVFANALWITQYMQDTPYDMLRDIAPVTLAVSQPSILAVNPALPVKSTAELIAYAKAHPGILNYASSGIGSFNQLQVELIKTIAQVDLTRINFKGSGDGITATVAGQTQVIIPTANATLPHIKSGRLRALAVTSAQPSALAPGLPTVASTLPGYEAVTLTGVFAPAKTPDAVIRRLNQEIRGVLTRSDVKEKLFTAGAEVVASTPEQAVTTIKEDMARWSKVIKDANIKAE